MNLLDIVSTARTTIEESKTLEWCEECSKWEQQGSLTFCSLKKARRLLQGDPEPRNLLSEKPKPWKEV